MDVFSLASKSFQDNFSNFPHGNSFLPGSDFVNSENFDPNDDRNYNYNTEALSPSPMKSCSETEQDLNHNTIFCSDDDMSPSGRKYSSRRATSQRRNRINERERDRMHQLCHGFEKLRTVLPYKRAKRGPNRQKLSKIATLLLAQNYIRTLEDMLRRPTEYTNTTSATTTSAAPAVDMVSQALVAAGVPAVSNLGNLYNEYDTTSGTMASTMPGRNGGMTESSYAGGSFHGPGMSSVQDSSTSPYYYHDYTDYRDYHGYGRGTEPHGVHRVFAAEHAYPYL